jgi:hypothetical protein
MTYSARDSLRITAKISNRLPIPGAADVFVTDVVYGGQGEQYRYVFTTEYTIGVVRGKRRQVRVGMFSEPRDRRAAAPSQVVFAPEGLPVLEQYEAFSPLASSSPSLGNG